VRPEHKFPTISPLPHTLSRQPIKPSMRWAVRSAGYQGQPTFGVALLQAPHNKRLQRHGQVDLSCLDTIPSLSLNTTLSANLNSALTNALNFGRVSAAK
jgi:hypothetical protein